MRCPVTAIYPEGEVPAEHVRFIAWNHAYFKDAARVRAEVNAAFPQKKAEQEVSQT